MRDNLMPLESYARTGVKLSSLTSQSGLSALVKLPLQKSLKRLMLRSENGSERTSPKKLNNQLEFFTVDPSLMLTPQSSS